MRILFVCHGNICRSPMAQAVMENLVKIRGLQDKIHCDSKATHTDEIGSAPYYETKRVLREKAVPLMAHTATQITKADLEKFDLILCMDEENMRALARIFGLNSPKVKFLLEFAVGQNAPKSQKIIADPYYTRDFENCYDDIAKSCEALMQKIENLESF
ncbi:low molecular weight phosphotyrosine protein phosphatase [Campylobacter sp. VBCF_02 NA5]|uniref:low molecular weight protein-tyrosine-phosphatase n=1 Tax=unclassified Campylobacter TaxID=2593542 RepID=UPI0022E99A78|nr:MULTISPECIES: low molecular weight protein-tyrosine-phosphatase [unclassified Campylobacter]MDA3054088.1 low molecular weight phosphotyrosine protein phosphatase [Campylobacter sp. VBCF_07 NA4]MDA3060025.1 low molecular weight phosphotyrosine protein phosphatase [Campylobacter sp. VBCF_02 NA5]WBR53580.1 low molecular weight phosphotyrosine protein phosphatase [Campylobacter sp. VBCF_01 NA2]